MGRGQFEVRLSTEVLVERFRKVHGDSWDYSNTTYVNYDTKVEVVCPQHGPWYVSIANHSKGRGCPACGRLKSAVGRREAARNKRPDLSHIVTPEGSKAVPVGTKGDYALVDDEDYDKVMEHNWGLNHYGYAVNAEVGSMHRFIMNPPSNMEVDHINHNTLDNRKSKLRVCTHSQNARNSVSKVGLSIYKGVTRTREGGRWGSKIMVDRKKIHLGYFDDEIEAARAYDEAAKKYHKDFARLNFPSKKINFRFHLELT